MNDQELKEYMEKEIKRTNAQVSVYVKDMNSGRALAQFESDRRVVSASTIKTQIMLTALEQVRLGKLTLEQTVSVGQEVLLDDSEVFEYGPQSVSMRELIFWMIVNSDNTASNVLANLLGMEEVNRYCRDTLGLTQTSLQRNMLDFSAARSGRNNYTSAEDQARTFSALWNRSILTPELCDLALQTLKCNRDFRLALRYIDEPCQVAHKTGELSHLIHDTGLFFHPAGGAYFFGFFVTEDADDNGEKLIGRLNRAVYQRYCEK